MRPFLGHGKHADFIHRAKAVFDGANQAVRAVRVALKVQHRIDHVLQHARPGQCALFGHVADQDDGDARAFGHAGEVGGALAHLGHRAGGAAQLVGVHGLDRVNHRHRRLHGINGGQDFFELNFSQQIDLAALNAQTARAQRHLRPAFLAGDVQRGQAAALQRIHGLQQQGGFANAGVATDQHHAALDHAAAQHAVQLAQAAGGAGDILRLDGCQRGDRLGVGQPGIALGRAQAVFATAGRLGHGFHQAVPRAAAGAFAQPARRGAAAGVAGKKGFFFGHNKKRSCLRFKFNNFKLVFYEIACF